MGNAYLQTSFRAGEERFVWLIFVTNSIDCSFLFKRFTSLSTDPTLRGKSILQGRGQKSFPETLDSLQGSRQNTHFSLE